MIVAGTIYGVALNDRSEIDALSDQFAGKPYMASPKAPIVYIKPAICVARGQATVAAAAVTAAPTVALSFRRDACRVGDEAGEVWPLIGFASLALDLSYRKDDYYRPAVAQLNAPGFLPLGDPGFPELPSEIQTFAGDRMIHSWTFDRLVRPVCRLVSELSAFMTLRAGDLLLVGLPGDAPVITGDTSLLVRATGLPTLRAEIEVAA